MRTASSRLGIYELIRYDSHGYAIYEHETTKNTYLYSYSNNVFGGWTWMVGNTIHGQSDVLVNSKCPHTYCPNDCDNTWTYGHGGFRYDSTIRLETKVPTCCNVLNISSQGDGKHMYSNELGTYRYWNIDSRENRVYKHSSENIYLFKSGAGKWLVSTIIGSENGLLSHPYCNGLKCPESCAQKVWERGIAINNSYLTDDFLDVSCS